MECMKKWLVLFVLLSVAVAAADDLCVDSDNGGADDSDTALEVKGNVKYGITTKVDTCLSSQNGVSTNSGTWLLEYYCENDERKSETYNCVNLGYLSCYGGKCNGTSSVNTSGQSQQTQQQDHCGDGIVQKDKGEECEKPGDICFGDSTAEYGQCQSDCTCKIAEAAKKVAKEAPQICGDGTLHPDEDCEEDSDCEDNYVCSSCSCVKQLSKEEIEALKSKSKTADDEKDDETAKKDDVAKEIEEKYKVDEPPKVNLTAKNFSEDAGIKTTSSIATFFTKIFGWITALFS